MTNGAFLNADNGVFNGPLGRSLRSGAHTAHFSHLLHSTNLYYARFAMLALLACSTHKLTYSLCSLLHVTIELHEYVFTLWTRSMGTNAFIIFTRNTPLVFDEHLWFGNFWDLRMFVIYNCLWFTNVCDLRTFMIYERSWFTNDWAFVNCARA